MVGMARCPSQHQSLNRVCWVFFHVPLAWVCLSSTGTCAFYVALLPERTNLYIRKTAILLSLIHLFKYSKLPHFLISCHFISETKCPSWKKNLIYLMRFVDNCSFIIYYLSMKDRIVLSFHEKCNDTWLWDMKFGCRELEKTEEKNWS